MMRIVAVPRRAYALMRWLVILEVGIWRSLFLWVTRRVAGRGPGVETFSYAKDLAPLLGAFIFVSLIELPVVHVLLPWETVRLVAAVLSVWGLLWMVGFLASMKVFPHLLGDDGLRVRNGTSVDIRVPWDAVASVTSRRHSVESRKSVHVEREADATVVSVPVLKQTRIDVALRRPTTVELSGGTEEVTEVRFYVDDPRTFVRRARERLAARLPEQQAVGVR